MERALEGLDGISDAEVDWQAGHAVVHYNLGGVSPRAMIEAVREAGFGCELPPSQSGEASRDGGQVGDREER